MLLLQAAAAVTAHAEKKAPAPARTAGSAVAGTQIPDAYKLNMLIRTTLIALSQANQTGNYSVLRDLGTPQFQASNSDARLGEIFSALRQRQLDFSPILFFDPKLVRPAAVQSNGLLRLTGYIDTRPERVLFDMGFELVQESWRLSAIIVDMRRIDDNGPAAASAEQPKTAPSKGTAKQTKPQKKPASAPQ
jgi:hypothetical protein